MITSYEPMLRSGSSFYDSLSPRPNTHQVLLTLRKTIRSFELKNKSIYRQYKSNLKQGLEKKIATYKLQSLIIRKEEKQKMKNEMKERQRYFSEIRRKSIQQKKLERLSSRIYVVETLEEKANQARKMGQIEKQGNEKTINEKDEKFYLEKIQKRIKVNKQKNQSKKLREQKGFVADMKQRQFYANEMKKQLQNIIHKEQQLEILEQQLRRLEEDDPYEAEAPSVNRNEVKRSLAENYIF